jgi:hypothetical protein
MTDWHEVMRGYGGTRPDDNDMVQITRGTARLALASLHNGVGGTGLPAGMGPEMGCPRPP